MRRARKLTLSLTVQYAQPAPWLPPRPRLRRWVAATLEQDAQITLRFVDAAEGRSLNRRYRGRNHATNVLTFIYEQTAPLAGDIVLCVPVMEREARAQGKALDTHCAHLVVHGVLHLQGYDHRSENEARRMQAHETAILARMGMADPYSR